MKQVLMVSFSGTLDTGQVGDLQMMKDKLRWKRIVSRFEGKLVKVIENVGGSFGDYSIIALGL